MQPHSDLDPMALVFAGLALLVLSIALVARERSKAVGQLEAERRARAHVENELERNKTRVDQLLDKMNGEDGDDEPKPTSG